MKVKGIKKSLKILGVTLLALLTLVGISVMLIRSPKVQTWLTSKIASYLEDELGTEVRVGSVDLSFFDRAHLGEVLIRDQKQDTLIYARELEVSILSLGIDSNKFDLGRVKLIDPVFYLKRFPGNEGLNIDFLIDYFSSKDTTSKPHKVTTITARSIELSNARFAYKDQRDSSSTRLINFEDIGITALSGRFQDLEVIDDSIGVSIQNLTFKDKSGFMLTRFSAEAKISSTGMWCKEMLLTTPFSKIDADLEFKTSSYDDYNDFIEKVYMQADFRYSQVASRDIAWFANEVYGLDRTITLHGKTRGTVNDLKGKNIEIAYGKNTAFKGDFSLTGLPEIDETFIHLKIKELVSDKTDIESIPLYPFHTPGKIEVPANIGMLGKVKFSGDFTGFINDFVAYGSFQTALGNLASDISLSRDTVTHKVKYRGNLKTFAFDIGRFYRVPETVGRLTMDVSVDGKGLVLDKMDLKIDGQVNSLSVKGYEYKNITAKGTLLKKIFQGSVAINDPNMTFTFDGNVDFTQKLPLLDFTADIKTANLSATNLYKTEPASVLSTTVVFKIRGNDIDNINGNIAALRTTFSKGDQKVVVESFDLIAAENKGEKAIQVFSDVVDAEIRGRFNSKELVNSFVNVLHKYLPSLYADKTPRIASQEQNFHFAITAKNTDQVTEMFYPDVDLNSNMKVSGDYSSSAATFNVSASSKNAKVHGMLINDLALRANAKNHQFNSSLNIGEVFLSDTLSVQNIKMVSQAESDSVQFRLDWKNDEVHRNEGHLKGLVDLNGSMPVKLRIDPSSFYLHDSLWTLTNSGNILIDSGAVLVPALSIQNNNQKVFVTGVLNQYQQTPLNIRFSDFKLSNLNPILHPTGIDLYGNIQGNAALFYKEGKFVFSSDLSFTDFMFNEEKLGDGNIIAEWDPVKDGITMNGKFLRGSLPTIAFSGDYLPSGKEKNFDIKVTLQKTQLRILQPYIKDIATDLKGFVSGEMFLKGTVAKPELTGAIALQKVGFKVDYLNTSYTFSNTITLNKSSIDFGNMILFDENGNEATVNGSVKHNFFSDISFDITVNAKNFLCLNTGPEDNQLYFGKAFSTGRIKLQGDPKNIMIDVKARTEKGTQFNVPLEGAKDVAENSFVTFKGRDTIALTSKKYDVDLSGIQLQFDLEVTPDAEVQLIFDPKVGDIIKGRGNGDLKLEINTLGVFKMFGDYVIKEGDYLFTLQNVINKRFKVEQGGTITWSGDPYNAEINLDAVYKLRTSLTSLFPHDTTATYKKRIPVDCILNMSDKLMNPTIKFNIALPPTVDESIRTEVKNKINPENEQELNKQIFSLLILGTFYNPDQGFANNDSQLGSSLGANSTELLSNQLSNWLAGSIKWVDVGVKYHGKDVELNLSKQLFNERLSIDGNLGYVPENTSSVIGDVIAEYKVSKDGKLRVKAFTQANDYTTSYNGTTSKQGVGISYREDFDTMGELLRRYRDKFRRKKKVEEKPVEAVEQPLKKEEEVQ